jgi:hypothetical protein
MVRALIAMFYFMWIGLFAEAQINSVHFAYYMVTPFGNLITIQWVTLEETNTVSFSIQKKTGNENFIPLAELNAAGNSTTPTYYNYVDELPTGFNCYSYRLDIKFNDQSHEYSDIHTECFFPTQTIFPNPFTGETQIIFNDIASADDLRIYFYDTSGRDVAESTIEKIVINSTLHLVFKNETLANGLYLLKIFNGNHSYYFSKLIAM